MTDNVVFTHIASELLPIFEELCCREPIFHTAAFGTTLVDFERVMAPDYWEVGASGRRYSRDFILRNLQQKPPIDAASAGWQSSDYGLRRLGPDTYLFTYTRCTRRSASPAGLPFGKPPARAGAFSIIRERSCTRASRLKL
jgi:hypothetical protein